MYYLKLTPLHNERRKASILAKSLAVRCNEKPAGEGGEPGKRRIRRCRASKKISGGVVSKSANRNNIYLMNGVVVEHVGSWMAWQ